MTTDSKVDSGLEGVVVAESALSRVDGEAGRLIIAGYDIAALAEQASYEQVCALLWEGLVPSAATHAGYRLRLAEARMRAFEELPRLSHALALRDPMDALRASLALLCVEDRDGPAQALAVTAATAVFAAARTRTSHGLPALAPDPTLDHARDYLRMMRGVDDVVAAPALGRYLVTLSDHDMNASTFAARVVASTGSDIVSAVVAAVGALKGPLHGGAPGPVLDMLDAVAAHGDAREWLQAELDAGRRIMGMGHRVYRVRDPRAAVLEAALGLLGQEPSGRSRLEVGRRVEQAARSLLQERSAARRLEANVEFYTAVLLDAVGIDRRDFSPTFATARVAGWCAHVLEHRRSGRLVRPALRYVGPQPDIAA